MDKQRVIPHSRTEEALAALWGAAPDVSKIFDLSDTPKPKVSAQSRTEEDMLLELWETPSATCRLERSRNNPRISELERIFAAYHPRSLPNNSSPVKATLDSIAKAKDLIAFMEQDLSQSSDRNIATEETLPYTPKKEKERPCLSRVPVPYSWETRKW